MATITPPVPTPIGVRSAERAPLARAVWFVAGIKLILTLAFITRYGWHRDEFYYVASARHLDWGFVDYPPLTPALARLVLLITGPSLAVLRSTALLAGTAVLLLSALLARELGGRAYAQVIAALAVLCCPMVLGANTTFETVSFDQFFWALTLFLAVLILHRPGNRLWILLGVVAGLGLLTKYTIVALLAGLATGLLLTPQRRLVRTPGPWLAAAIALLMLLPNLLWQVHHGWASLDYITAHHGRIAQDGGRTAYLLQQIVLIGPLAVPLALIGAWQLWVRPVLRPLGWAVVTAFLLLLVAGGKSYYFGPAYPLLFAAGAVWLECRGRWVRRSLPALVVASGLALLPLSIPILPPATMVASGLWHTRSDYGDEVGWPEMLRQVAYSYHHLPPSIQKRVVILASNYGEAGDIALFGPTYGLPQPISAHLTWYYWKPTHLGYRPVLAIGFSASWLQGYFVHVRQVGTVRNALGMDNEEQNGPILLGMQPRHSLDAFWPGWRHED